MALFSHVVVCLAKSNFYKVSSSLHAVSSYLSKVIKFAGPCYVHVGSSMLMMSCDCGLYPKMTVMCAADTAPMLCYFEVGGVKRA